MVGSVDQLKSLMTQRNGIARPNLFRVRLPSLPGATSEELNILCKDVVLPGRQILTSERRVGLKTEKVPYGYGVNDVSLTFHVLNDYGVKEYFEVWQNLAVDQNNYSVGYMRGAGGYGKTVTIEQLRKVEKIPSYLQGKNFKRNGIQQFLPRLEDIDIVRDFYNFAEGINDLVIYKCELENAFPTTMTDIQLNNELDGVVELNIQLSYTNWRNRDFISPTNIKQAIRQGAQNIVGTFINDTIDDIRDDLGINFRIS